jgi:hypothetical protein
MTHTNADSFESIIKSEKSKRKIKIFTKIPNMKMEIYFVTVSILLCPLKFLHSVLNRFPFTTASLDQNELKACNQIRGH